MSTRTPANPHRNRRPGLALVALLALAGGSPALAQVVGNASDCATSRAQESIDRVGAAMLAWLTDVVSGLDAVPERGVSTCIGSAPVDIALVPTIPVADLRVLLVPLYIDSIPANDPWGTPYEYRLNVANPLSAYAIALRSAGSDRLFEGATYDVGATQGPAEDLVLYNLARVRQRPRFDSVSRQESTREQMFNLGWAILAWATDYVPLTRSARGGPAVDLSLITPITAQELAALITPFYIPCIESVDGWGHGYDLRLNDDLLSAPLLSIRSAGSDGIVEGNVYDTEIFPADDFYRDLVWSDGQNYQSPSSTRATVFTDDFESATLWGTWSCGPGF